MKKLTLVNVSWSRDSWVGFLYLPLNGDGIPVLDMDKFCRLTGMVIPRGTTFSIT